jgi:hypothetical protein
MALVSSIEVAREFIRAIVIPFSKLLQSGQFTIRLENGAEYRLVGSLFMLTGTSESTGYFR